jgi:DNA recombination protein RmuC
MDLMLIILVTLNLVIVVGLVIFLFNRKPANNTNLGDLDIKLDSVKDNLRDAITKTMLNFNESVNSKLIESMRNSNKDLTEFKEKSTQDFVKLQDGINNKLQEQFKVLNIEVEKRMTMINEKVELRLTAGLEKSNKTFETIVERMAIIDKAQTNITNLSSEMVSLQNVLSNNQSRGAFGEYQLNQILMSAYGENDKLYKTQYEIKEKKGGEKVRADAIIFLPEPHHLVAIDSKFPFSSFSKLLDKLEPEVEVELLKSFKSEVKKHITDVADKYIVAGKTADYALMFVASDGVLAMLHSKAKDIIDHALAKNVVIVSPTTIYPLLQSLRVLFYDYERAKSAKEITYQLGLLNKDFGKLATDWNDVNATIARLGRQGERFDDRVNRLTENFTKIKTVNFIEEVKPESEVSDE